MVTFLKYKDQNKHFESILTKINQSCEYKDQNEHFIESIQTKRHQNQKYRNQSII